MRIPTLCICENKDADQLRGICEADQCLRFRYTDGSFLYFLKPKCPASSHLLCLYSSVCAGLVRKQHCWFSYDVAHLFIPIVAYCFHVHLLFSVELVVSG